MNIVPVDWNLVEELHSEVQSNRAHTLHDYALVRELVAFISLMGATGIVETGTGQGGTTRFLATVFPKLPLLTCDVTAVDEFVDFPNIYSRSMASTKFLPTLRERDVGKSPFFFLDAHARSSENPLVGELTAIVDKLEQGVFDCAGVAVHDFEVPDQPHLGWNAAEFDGTDQNWETIQFVAPYVQLGLYPPGQLFSLPLYGKEFQAGTSGEPNPRGRIFLFMSLQNGPEQLAYLYFTGLFNRFI